MTTRQPGSLPDRLRGIGLMCLATMCFVLLDTGAKYLAQTYPVSQVIWARYTSHLVLMLLLLGPRLGHRLWRTRRLGMQMVRSLLLFGATAFMFTALKFIPLADAATISFINPLIVTALSVPLLKERVEARRWAAILVGFAGVLVVLRPGSGAMHPAAFLPLGMALCFAFYQIATRMLAGSDHPVTTLFYTALVGTVITSAGAPAYWQPPTTGAWLIMTGLGVIAGTGHFALIKAFERAPASVVSPFGYIQLVWVAIAGYLFFDAIPDRWTVAGASIIVASGLYIIHREELTGRLD